MSAVNWCCTLLVPPRPIMRLDFSNGIPAEYRTLVVIPTLLTSLRRSAAWPENWSFATSPTGMPNFSSPY